MTRSDIESSVPVTTASPSLQLSTRLSPTSAERLLAVPMARDGNVLTAVFAMCGLTYRWLKRQYA